MASGDGIIIKAGWCGGGGNCVKIKHNTTPKQFMRICQSFQILQCLDQEKQGQIIGFMINWDVNRSTSTL